MASKWIKNWFSNMEKMDEPLFYQNMFFHTVENFYQAMKIPKEEFGKRMMISMMKPFEAKKAIRDEKEFKWREDWNRDEALRVMEYALRWKFKEGTSWYKKLMKTRSEPIIEWNNWKDTFWGIDNKTKQGENHLGKILMKIRDEYSNRSNS